MMATGEKPLPGDQGPPGAAVWLDERNEWQVLGIVRHDEGTIRLSDGQLTVTSGGVRGLIRRQAWSKNAEVPVAGINSIRVTGRGRGHRVLDVQIRESAAAADGALELKNCRPAAALRALLEQIELANTAVKVEWVNPPAI